MPQGILSRSTIALRAIQAAKLSTPRSISVNLSNSAGASFDGTKDIVIGTSGILSTSKGGTGLSASSLNDLKTKLGVGDSNFTYTCGFYSGTGSGYVYLNPNLAPILFVVIDLFALNSYNYEHKEMSYQHKDMCIAMGEKTETLCIDDTEQESIGHTHIYRTRVTISNTSNQICIQGEYDTNTLNLVFGNYSSRYSFNASGHNYAWVAIGRKSS